MMTWKAGEWEEFEITNFGDPVRRMVSTRPSADAMIDLACMAYVRDDIGVETFELTVGIALGLKDGDIAILSGGMVVPLEGGPR